MTRFGYTLSSEEHAPADLVANARRAEELGFEFATVSDHFHPWVSAQGHSPFVWSVLGAIAAATERLEVAVGVTCPLVRIHPVIIAHAAATTQLLFGGRFTLGVGTGEALNEHVLGHRWPTPELRLAMLDEAVGILRDLWTGETVDHDGAVYRVENARLFDVPPEPVPLVVSAFGTTAAELAAEIGDGLWTHGSSTDAIDAFHDGGGKGPVYAQLNVCLGEDADACRRTVHEGWPNGGIPGQLSQDLPTFTHFEQAAQLVREEDAVGSMPVGDDLDAVVEQARTYIDNGVDHVHLHQIGPDQDALLQRWSDGLGDRLRAL